MPHQRSNNIEVDDSKENNDILVSPLIKIYKINKIKQRSEACASPSINIKLKFVNNIGVLFTNMNGKPFPLR